MPPRNVQRSCHNCPLPTPTTQRVPALAAEPPTKRYDVATEDALKLWRHVLFGTGTCVDMIEGYAKHGMAGDPINGIKHLRDRLNHIIQLLKDRANAHDSSPSE